MLPRTGLRMYSRDQRGVAPADCWNRDKWGLTEYKWSGPSVVGSLGSSCRYKRFLSCLGCSNQNSTKYFFSLPHTFWHYCMCPHRPAIWEDVVQGRLSLNMCLRLKTKAKTIDSQRKNYKLWKVGRKREFWAWALLCCVTVEPASSVNTTFQ